MSLIDTRFPDLDLFLQRWQRRLNTRVSQGEGLAAWSVVGILAAGGTFLLVGDPTTRMAVWGFASAVSALTFVLWRRRRRLSRHQAASWLDERCQTEGVFRAASECLEKDDLAPSERHVLDQATRRSLDFSGRQAPRLPWRRWALRWVLALGLSVLALTALSLVPPLPGLRPSGSGADAPEETSPSESAPSESAELTPHEAAQRLFPEDARLAALAEQALASGDPGALDALLEQNAERASAEKAAPPQGGAPGQGQQGQEGSGGAGADPASGRPEGSPGASQSQGQGGSSDTEPGSKGKPSDTQGQEPGAGEGSQSEGPLGQGSGANRPGQPGSGNQQPLSSGGAPGTSHSEQPLGLRPQTGTSDQRLKLKETDNPGIFEYVLPGTGPQLPSAQTLADSRRSAETIISRTAPPLEFENTIRDYFLSLSALTESKETSP